MCLWFSCPLYPSSVRQSITHSFNHLKTRLSTLRANHSPARTSISPKKNNNSISKQPLAPERIRPRDRHGRTKLKRLKSSTYFSAFLSNDPQQSSSLVKQVSSITLSFSRQKRSLSLISPLSRIQIFGGLSVDRGTWILFPVYHRWIPGYERGSPVVGLHSIS